MYHSGFNFQTSKFCMFPLLSAWLLSGFSGFKPQSINMHVRLIGKSELHFDPELNDLIKVIGK